jgi:RNase P subunit RPR2
MTGSPDMKVLKAVNLKDWRKECQCSNCLSLLEVQLSDLVYFQKDGEDGVKLVCPVCNRCNWKGLNQLVDQEYRYGVPGYP